ncbi:hypothetical protein FKM82_026508, partial [Ascaphus truei]
RWLCYCHVPQSCDSLPRHETTQVFGRSLLRSIFTVTRRQLLEKFRVEKDKLVPEKRTLILTHFPKFLSMLEEEIYGETSPIWESDFTVPTAEGPPLVPRPAATNATSVPSAPMFSGGLIISSSLSSSGDAGASEPMPGNRPTAILLLVPQWYWRVRTSRHMVGNEGAHSLWSLLVL